MPDEHVPAPASANPLMQPVQYNGQMYYTSQYFHVQYLAGHQNRRKKYARYDSFMRMLRSLPLYGDYVSSGPIVELHYDKHAKESLTTELCFVFKSVGYKPLTLLNSTAQAELSHHLEDEMSKQLAHAANKKVTRESQSSHSLLVQAKEDIQTFLDIAVLYAAPKYGALIEATKYIERTYGLDLRPMLQISTEMDAIPAEHVMLEPTELGIKLGNRTAKEMNQLLARLGWQQKVNGAWEATLIGERYSARHAWASAYSTKSGYNLKWNLSAVESAVQKHEITLEQD